MMLSIKIMPSMAMDTVYPWLEKFAKNKASLCAVEQKIELELAAKGIIFWDDLWADILEHITMSPTGWQDVQAAWQSVKMLGEWCFYSAAKVLIFLYCKAPPLLDDLCAWHLLQAWAYGQASYTQVTDMMGMVFGECYDHEEWHNIINAMCEVWEHEEDDASPQTRKLFKELIAQRGLSLPPLCGGCSYLLVTDVLCVAQDDDHLMWSSSTSSTSKKKQKTNGQSSSNDLHRFDMGVIDLTWWKDDDNGAEAGSSDILQKRQRSQSLQQADAATSKALHKQQKTCSSR